MTQDVPVFNPPADMLTLGQVAALLGSDVKSVQSLIKKGRLIDSRIPGFPNRVVVARRQLERYAARKGIALKTLPKKGTRIVPGRKTATSRKTKTRTKTRTGPKPKPQKNGYSLGVPELRQLALALIGGTANVYSLVESRHGIKCGDEIFERLEKEEKIFRCDNCSRWQHLQERAVGDTCHDCLDEIDAGISHA